MHMQAQGRTGPRISFIAWGRRRLITSRNSGQGETTSNVKPDLGPPPGLAGNVNTPAVVPGAVEEKETVMTAAEVFYYLYFFPRPCTL